MTVSMRTCAGPVDFPAISDFLYGLYQPSYRAAGASSPNNTHGDSVEWCKVEFN